MRVVVGRIGKPHGVKGDVTIEVRTDEPELHFHEDTTFFTAEHGELTCEYAWYHGKIMCAKFAGYNDRNAAEMLRNTLLEIERDPMDRPEDPDEFYDAQLVGLQVVADETVIGMVSEVIHTPAQDLLAVSTDDGEVLIPFVAAIVTEVDLPAGTLSVTVPEGLLEINRSDALDED